MTTATGFWSQNTKSPANNIDIGQNEKVYLDKKWSYMLCITVNIANVDEKSITRESICDHFRLCGLGWGKL